MNTKLYYKRRIIYEVRNALTKSKSSPEDIIKWTLLAIKQETGLRE